MTHSSQPLPADLRLRLGLPELEQALHAVDPAAVLVPGRILRRVIKEDAALPGLGLRVAHRKSYVIGREALLSIVDPADLDLGPGVVLPEIIILLARPAPERMGALSAEQILLKYWRLLFHARVHLAFDQLLADGRLSPEGVRHRIARIGATEFEEIRSVLRHEDFLVSPKNDVATYVEFAAVYLELRHFAETFLTSYFPSVDEFSRFDLVLRDDVDAAALAAATRLPGAPDPLERSASAQEPGEQLPIAPAASISRRSESRFRRAMNKAVRVSRLGNQVRSAILRTRGTLVGRPDQAREARAAARVDLDRLAARLQDALGFGEAELLEWTRALPSLLDQAARGIWTPAARLLYDLQKVCVDHERGVYSLDLLGWLLKRGPLKRLLPGQRDVLMVKHLRGALARLPATRLTQRGRARLSALLQGAIHRTEGMLRARFWPAIESVLDRVELVPHNVPERVARKKLVAELLDRIVERGFLSMGDLRDALSRNNLKLPDLAVADLAQWWRGDQLLDADRRLRTALDGVYRRGEIYLRLPQRLSSLAFGTQTGRFLTRYVALPFGGAYLILEGVYKLAEEVVRLVRGPDETPASAGHAGASQAGATTLWWAAIGLLGLFLMGLLHHAGFRQACAEAAWGAGQGLRTLLLQWPARLLRLPLVQAVLASPYFRLFRRYVFKPLWISAIIAMFLSVIFDRQTTLESATATFVVVNLLLNSRLGRNVDELITDWIVQAWHRVRIHVFAAVFRFILELFNRLLETIERLLYTVDEWLRFKAGESRATTAAKAVLGVIWSVAHYVIRIYVNLLIEPQVNPIKHFPVVTVSHKIMLPFSIMLAEYLAAPLMPLGPVWANTIAGANVFLLPGAVGFLVWELKENWRLYEANRPAILRPVAVGHHGENVVNLMRPGFRSGTLPKIYAKLRKAHRKAYWTGNWRVAGKQAAALHGVEEQLRRFVERDFLELLAESRGWQSREIAAGEIRLGTNRILIELYCPACGETSLWLTMEEKAGWLLAGIHLRGWLDRLAPAERLTFAAALAGFYTLAGVDLVREQLDTLLDQSRQDYEILDQGLMVHAHQPLVVDTLVPLRDWPPRPEQPWSPVGHLPELDQLVFARRPIRWTDWLAVWNRDQQGGAPALSLIAGPSIV